MNEFEKDDVNITEANASDTRASSAIRGALKDILTDEKFLASPQMSAFLTYVVQETMAGNADRIKAYTVAVDALGKPASFDPQNDPSVRVLANRLRASLDNYYANNPEQSLFIELYRGSYVPHFVDSIGYEHVQGIVKHKPADANGPLLKRYEKIESLYASPSSMQGVNATRGAKQHSTDPVNRVSSWLLSGGKKYG